MTRHRFTLLIALAATCVMGCRTMNAGLEPAANASSVPELENAARADNDNLTVVADVSDWPGDAYITQAVTPIRVTVTNRGQEAVRVRLEDFTLVGESGRIYRALPPLSVTGTVDVVDSRRMMMSPGFEYDHFLVSRPYSTVYPNVGVYDGPYGQDFGSFDYYDGHWDVEQRLPTPQMITAAMPEGVIESGGFVSGWVYFQKLGDEDRVWFQANLRSPDETPLAELQIPFEDD